MKLARYDRRIAPTVEAPTVGDPFDERTRIGPLAKASFVDDIDRQVHASIAEGATLLVGGARLDRPDNYYAPTVLTGVTVNMDCSSMASSPQTPGSRSAG